jgi:putative hydrolase of the HAD superfamily
MCNGAHGFPGFGRKFFINKMEFPFKYSAYLFDLDNTLYNESDYLFPAYRQIADMISKRTEGNVDEITQFLIDQFSTSGREKLFDLLFSRFNITDVSVDECLHVLRNANPGKLELYTIAYDTLIKLKNNGKILAVITNGNVEQQKNKVRCIDWKGLDKCIEFIFANATEKKPSPATINYFLGKHSVLASDVLFVGDGKEDEKAANAAGVDFMFTNFIGNNS